MRPALAATVLLMLLAPEAWAQVGEPQPARIVPVPAEIAAQASFNTGYLLALYMAQLAGAGSPPSQADIDAATQRYFTQGAGVTSVPTSGAAAAYFQNGASVTSVPSSGPGAEYFRNGAAATDYAAWRAPIQRPPAPAPSVAQVEAKSSASAAPTESAPAPVRALPSVTAPSAATGLSCSPAEIEAAMAFASQFATAAAVPAERAATVCPPPATPAPFLTSAEVTPSAAAEPAARCAPSLPPKPPGWMSRVLAALGGTALGGVAMALWSRPRSPRTSPMKTPRRAH